jgi:hypothetical protein
VYEATSSDALQEFSMEPEIVKWMAWNTSEIKVAMSFEESMKLQRARLTNITLIVIGYSYFQWRAHTIGKSAKLNGARWNRFC